MNYREICRFHHVLCCQNKRIDLRSAGMTFYSQQIRCIPSDPSSGRKDPKRYCQQFTDMLLLISCKLCKTY